MRRKNFLGLNPNGREIVLTMLAFTVVCFMPSCKKEHMEPTGSPSKPDLKSAAALVSETDETNYSLANYQDALEDVSISGGRLQFVNTKHFVITAMALDSIGDSTADVWLQSIGFSSLYHQFKTAIANMPDDENNENAMAQFFTSNTNSIYSHSDGSWDINADNAMFARLLNTEHKAVIGGNVYYSNYNVDVTVGLSDENLIPIYRDQADDQDNEQAIVEHQHTQLKTTGPICVDPGYGYYLGEINCGSPIQKRSRARLEAWSLTGSTGKKFTGGIVKIWHDRRGWFGTWKAQNRGSHVIGTFNGKYYNRKKVWGDEAAYHEYGVSLDNGWAQVCGSSITICVAVMCNNDTQCAYW